MSLMADEAATNGESFAPFLAAIAHYKAVFGEGNIKPVSSVGLDAYEIQLLLVLASTHLGILLLCRSFG
jgi:hypothetical protein